MSIHISSCIGKDELLIMPYMPTIDEWIEFRNNPEQLREFASKCTLVKNIGQPTQDLPVTAAEEIAVGYAKFRKERA